MKIAIIGVGAMGSVYAALLAEAGHDVWAQSIPGRRMSRRSTRMGCASKAPVETGQLPELRPPLMSLRLGV